MPLLPEVRPHRSFRGLLLLAVLLLQLGVVRGQSVVINEFMASNRGAFLDEDGDASDWLELRNLTAGTVSLDGWYLTDDPTDLTRWRIPDVSLGPDGYLVVFASGKDRAVAGSPLHASFNLDGDGDFLALTRPNGFTVEHAYAPQFPPQRNDVSYGLYAQSLTLLEAGASGHVLVPSDDSLGRSWTERGFAPGAGWTAAASGVGFSTESEEGLHPDTRGYWPLDGTLDDLALGNDAVYVGGASPSYVSGFDGGSRGAIAFGGLDYLEVSGAGGVPVHNEPEYTVALWVKGSPQSDKRVYSEGSSSNNSPLFTIGTDNTGATGAVDIYIRGDGGEQIMNHAKSSRTAFDGTWHHIAWVDRNGDATLYVDGIADPTSFSYSKQALSLDVVSVAAVLRAAVCCNFTGSIDEVGAWSVALTAEEVADLAAGASPGSGDPYGDLIATDLEDAMLDVNASAYLRFPFSVDEPAAFDSLVLRIRYDDGFVAYLNGAEVARRNAPAAPTWSSSATAERDPRDGRSVEGISLTAHVDALVSGENVLAIQGLNSSASDPDFLVAPELVAAASGVLEGRYFSPSTPGSANIGGVIDFVADTTFTVDRGFFDAPFDVEILCATPDAEIRYTTDQSAPTATHGEVYAGPIRIGTTTTLRAAAFREGFEPSNVDTQTYIFLDHVLGQSPSQPGYPTVWQGYPADYAMDPEICTNTQSPHYHPQVRDALESLPTMSLVIDRDDWMGPTRGIYTHSLQRGDAWERPASVEMLYPDGSEEGYQVDCGVRMHGNSSARPGEGKHSFRIIFRADYGPAKLGRRFFRDSRAERIDTLVLRCFSTDSWHFKDGGSRYRRWDSQFIRDIWMRDTQLATGQLSAHSTYVHLYVNGMYWGIYNPSERPDDEFQALYQGDEPEDWDIVKDFNELFRGNRDSWNQLMSLAGGGLGTDAAYQRIQGNNPDGTRNPSYPVLLDVDNLIDYMILHLFACSEDWPHHNWYGARSRTGNLGGWRFFVWDQEIVMDFVFRNRIDVNNDNSPARVYAALRANPEFRLRFADHLQRLLFHGGPLSIEGCRELWLRRSDEIDLAVVAESARWGDYRMDVPDPSNSPATLYTREDHWLPEKQKVLDEYIPESHRLALERFRAGNLYPSTPAPVLSRHGGIIELPFSLEIVSTGGTVYYTLDGGDPRLPGGAVSPEALVAGEATTATLVASGAPCRAIVPDASLAGLEWTSPAFDDSSWSAGTTGVGFEEGTGYEDLIGLDVGAAMFDVNASVYFRVPFEVSDPSAVTALRLRMKYDDGFVAYLNGERIAGANDPAEPTWSSEATGSHSDSEAVVFQDFDLAGATAHLRAGANVLAIHGLNSSERSTDLIFVPELVSVDAASSAIPLNGATVVRARTFDGSWSALTDAFFYLDLPLRVTEILYHPSDVVPGDPRNADDFEFLEMQNVSEASLALDGFRVLGGIDFEFVGTGIVLSPGEVLILAKDPPSFLERYPNVPARVVGGYDGRLANGGDWIQMEGPAGEPVLDFEYEDTWYPETDGSGRSLIIADALLPRDAWGERESWLASPGAYGSPGVVEFGPNFTGGWQLPSDVNQDARVDLSDGVSVLLTLFVGEGGAPPCEGGDLQSGGNLALYDSNGDAEVNLSDAVYLLNYLFLGGPSPVLGSDCIPIEGCPSVCR